MTAGIGPSELETRLRGFVLAPLFVPACIAVGVLLRLACVLALPVEPVSDFAWYLNRAGELAAGLGYQESGHPTAFWPVGWPATLAIGLWLGGSGPLVVAAINLASAVVIMASIVWLGDRVVRDPIVGRLALAMYAIYPNHIVYTGVAATEPFYTALVLLACCMIWASRCRRIGLLTLAGILFGLATLVKPQTLAMPIGLLIAAALVRRELTLIGFAKAAVLVHVLLLAVVLPWSHRNSEVLGQPVLVSTNGGLALFIGANDEMTGGHYEFQDTQAYAAIEIPWSQRVERQLAIDRELGRAARQWILDNPWTYIGWMPKKVLLLWERDTDGFWSLSATYPEFRASVRFVQAVNQIYYLFVLLLSIAGALICVREAMRRRLELPPIAFLFCLPIFSSLLAAAFTGQIRYHYSAMPCLMLVAAWTLIRWHGAIYGSHEGTRLDMNCVGR